MVQTLSKVNIWKMSSKVSLRYHWSHTITSILWVRFIFFVHPQFFSVINRSVLSITARPDWTLFPLQQAVISLATVTTLPHFVSDFALSVFWFIEAPVSASTESVWDDCLVAVVSFDYFWNSSIQLVVCKNRAFLLRTCELHLNWCLSSLRSHNLRMLLLYYSLAEHCD